jgi:hypothetical protein
MRELSSKDFYIPKAAAMPLDRTKGWLDTADRGLGDCTLTLTLLLKKPWPPGDGRGGGGNYE